VIEQQQAGPHGWYCQVRVRKTGAPFTYWVNAPHMIRDDVAAHVAKHFPNVDFVSCDPAITPPDGNRMKHVPPEHFQHGILKIAMEERARVPDPPHAGLLVPRRLVERKRVL
jgi:hypothetical protein